MAKKTKTVSGSRRLSHAHPSHKNPPKHFTKVYWPYIPLLALVVLGLFGGIGLRPSHVTPNRAVLAYATEMSHSGLLSNTNAERTSRGLPALAANSKLNAAAQAKANDMVARDYWSHNTPDGQTPWVFISNAGYSYKKAGENLAYGFATSSATVAGWMNSSGHRANILDTAYQEVGFGFANAPNYVGTGEETVVVAMYATPQALAAETPTPAPASKTKNKSNPSTPVAASAPAQEQKQEEIPPPIVVAAVPEQFSSATPVGSDTEATRITRLQTLTGGNAPWSAVALSSFSVIVVCLWLTKHALVVKRAVTSGEQFILHHPALDMAVAAFIAVAVYLSASSGVIK